LLNKGLHDNILEGHVGCRSIGFNELEKLVTDTFSLAYLKTVPSELKLKSDESISLEIFG
jgi:hypothetical protein